MFQQFTLTPSVSSNADANTYDTLEINYYGSTQQAGTLTSFYQRGSMFGLAVNPADQNVYANEIWLKDALSATIMTLLLAVSQLPANSRGSSQLTAVLQVIVNQALNNSVISIGKELTEVQKLYIANITNDPDAWQQVVNSGYWLDAAVVSYVENSTTKYKAIYTLVYSKGDVIRKVEGTNVLI